MLDFISLQLINRLLAQHDWARADLQAHAGKHFCIQAAGLNLRYTIKADGRLSNAAADSDWALQIRLPNHALAAIGGGADGISRHAQVQGDAQLAETISQLMRHLRPDIGAALSPLVGNVMAQRVDDGVRLLGEQIVASGGRLGANVRDYLVSESPQIVAQDSLSEFSQSLRQLRDDLARLEKRIERL